jgi:hypothetical protein
MDRVNRFFERKKEKIKNKFMPLATPSTTVSRESPAGGGAHNAASLPSHPPASIDPIIAERGAISAVTPTSSSSAQQPISELRVEHEGTDARMSRQQSLPDTVTSKQANLGCDDVYY